MAGAVPLTADDVHCERHANQKGKHHEHIHADIHIHFQMFYIKRERSIQCTALFPKVWIFRLAG